MRYLPHTERSRALMLEEIGAASIEELFAAAGAPAGLAPSGLADHKSELEVDRYLRKLSERNTVAANAAFFVGCGAYRHHVPASVDHLIQRSEFLTSYTPYQPEISQGTLQYLFEFQTQVANLLGSEIANASLYDGSTGCGEAVLMAHRITRRKKAVLSGNLHPHYASVVKTISHMADYGVEEASINAGQANTDAILSMIDEETSCVVVQTPDVFGTLYDLTAIAEAAHEKGALLIAVVTEIVSLGAIKAPGDMGADIVVAEGQSIGNGLNFGGPYLGLFACREKYIRQMPGRVCGQTTDADGKRGFVLTLSTREQHIRREKATSNICTNSGLCCLSFNIHMTLLGETGLRKLAHVNHAKAVQLSKRLAEIEGVNVINSSFFNEFTVELSKPAAPVVEALAQKDILAGVPASRLWPETKWPETKSLENTLILAATETVVDEDIDQLCTGLKEQLDAE